MKKHQKNLRVFQSRHTFLNFFKIDNPHPKFLRLPLALFRLFYLLAVLLSSFKLLTFIIVLSIQLLFSSFSLVSIRVILNLFSLSFLSSSLSFYLLPLLSFFLPSYIAVEVFLLITFINTVGNLNILILDVFVNRIFFEILILS